MMTRQLLFIDGKWSEGSGGKFFSTINPATEEAIAEVAIAEKEDVDRAVNAARSAFAKGDWSGMPVSQRSKIIHRLADLILESKEELAKLESLDTGKPIRESLEGDIPRAAANFHFFADFALEDKGLVFQNPNETHLSFREPLGVVALITPWNLPLYLETWKLAPALMMGNSCILKPSELTPLTASFFAGLVEKAGLPKGVFNLIHGFGEKAAGEFLCSHSGVDAISFTGETSTGRAIMRSAAAGPTRVSFELGGKGATIVFADADFDRAVTESVRPFG